MMNDVNKDQTPGNSAPVNKLLLGASLGFQVGLLAMTWAFATDDAQRAADAGAYWQGVYLWSALIVASLALTGVALMQKEENLKVQIITTAAFAAGAGALSMGTILLTIIYGAFAAYGAIKIVRGLRG
jgi:hypothetical protein